MLGVYSSYVPFLPNSQVLVGQKTLTTTSDFAWRSPTVSEHQQPQNLQLQLLDGNVLEGSLSLQSMSSVWDNPSQRVTVAWIERCHFRAR